MKERKRERARAYENQIWAEKFTIHISRVYSISYSKFNLIIIEWDLDTHLPPLKLSALFEHDTPPKTNQTVSVVYSLAAFEMKSRRTSLFRRTSCAIRWTGIWSSIVDHQIYFQRISVVWATFCFWENSNEKAVRHTRAQHRQNQHL